MAEVKITDLHKSFGDKVIVDELNLKVGDGEFLTLLGPSGCGKTTTLRCVAGLERPDSGVISIGEKTMVVGGGKFVPPESRGIRMVFQSYALWPHLSVGSNVAYPLKAEKVPRSEISPRVQSVLNKVGLGGFADRQISSLSGGQQQRVALARALVSEPDVLLFDEPLSNLDARLRTVMRNELAQLHASMGATSIYVTHDQVEALTLSDRIAVMNQGKIHQIGTPEEIFGQPVDDFVASFVGYDNVLPGTFLGTDNGMDLMQLDDSEVILACSRSRSATLPEKSSAAVVIRAADVRVCESAVRNSIPMRVLTRGYVGDHIEYRLSWKERSLMMSLETGTEPDYLEVGETVYVLLPQSKVLSVGAA